MELGQEKEGAWARCWGGGGEGGSCPASLGETLAEMSPRQRGCGEPSPGPSSHPPGSHPLGHPTPALSLLYTHIYLSRSPSFLRLSPSPHPLAAVPPCAHRRRPPLGFCSVSAELPPHRAAVTQGRAQVA